MKSNKKWYELWNQRNIKNFTSKKIITPELSEQNRFMLAEANLFYGDTVCGIVLKDNYIASFNLKYLLSILNSKLIEWFYKRTTVPKAGGFFIYKVMFLKNIPIKSKINLRDNMTDLELIFNMLGEKATTEITQTNDSIGFNELKKDAVDGGNVAQIARKELERKTGKKVVSNKNNLELEDK